MKRVQPQQMRVKPGKQGGHQANKKHQKSSHEVLHVVHEMGRMGATLNHLQTEDVIAQVVHHLASWELLQHGLLEALQLLCLDHSVQPLNLDHDSKQHRELGNMVVQDDLGVKALLMNKFAVSNILDHHINQHHSHPPLQGQEWTQFSRITMFYRTKHLPAQTGQDGLSHSEPHEFVLVPATPTRTMLLPRKFSHNIEHVDRASASQLVATPVGCQGSPETNPEHFKHGFNKINPYLYMKDGQPDSFQKFRKARNIHLQRRCGHISHCILATHADAVPHQLRPLGHHSQVVQPEFTAGHHRPSEYNAVVRQLPHNPPRAPDPAHRQVVHLGQIQAAMRTRQGLKTKVIVTYSVTQVSAEFFNKGNEIRSFGSHTRAETPERSRDACLCTSISSASVLATSWTAPTVQGQSQEIVKVIGNPVSSGSAEILSAGWSRCSPTCTTIMDKPGRGIKSLVRDTPINKGESDDDRTLLEIQVEDEAADIPEDDHKELQEKEDDTTLIDDDVCWFSTSLAVPVKEKFLRKALNNNNSHRLGTGSGQSQVKHLPEALDQENGQGQHCLLASPAYEREDPGEVVSNTACLHLLPV